MIDIHSHILPHVDDGAKHLSMALDMLRMSIDSGVSKQILTPHIQPGRFDNQPNDLVDKFLRFQEQANKANLDIELELAAELHIGAHIMSLAKQNAIPGLGYYNDRLTFLLELPHNSVPNGSSNLIKWLLDNGYQPVIAHPERNLSIQKRPKILDALIKAGALTQLTSRSLRGGFGFAAQQLAERLIKKGKAFALASDCHNITTRKPDLKQGHDIATSLVGAQKATNLTLNNPALLTQPCTQLADT